MYNETFAGGADLPRMANPAFYSLLYCDIQIAISKNDHRIVPARL